MRPREQGGASTERRTGADPEKSNPPTPPGEWLQEVVNNGDFAKEISKLTTSAVYPMEEMMIPSNSSGFFKVNTNHLIISIAFLMKWETNLHLNSIPAM
ncbi:hypothetical protein T4A_2846 [Trichinella pseudospiralis]|uniref:Uncharacterized protein n=1 Tax=Trichinella pseudospiralis TaxID=6337 RepID=A0A0V1EMZ8_TRIPS|nr:hypothetical protein T4A_2846 [Trichinella pseudospiralis]